MLKKVLLGLGFALVVFLGYVAMQPAQFLYMRGIVINAPPEKIYPYVSDFRLGNEWSPFIKVDPNIKLAYSGPPNGKGAKMTFDGNQEAGSGEIEILRAEPHSEVELQLTMTKPFKAVNTVRYQLVPEGNGTRFTWSMAGENGFLGKLVGIFIDCEKMIGDQFDKGQNNLKELVEAKTNSQTASK